MQEAKCIRLDDESKLEDLNHHVEDDYAELKKWLIENF